MVLVRILERCGATCLKACSGEEGIDAAVRHIGEIDLVLMDRQMPDIDGCEAAEAIRNLEGARRCPSLPSRPVQRRSNANGPPHPA